MKIFLLSGIVLAASNAMVTAHLSVSLNKPEGFVFTGVALAAMAVLIHEYKKRF